MDRVEAACELGESPLWDHRANCLWWIDAMSCEILHMTWQSRAVSRFPTPSIPGAIALMGATGLLVACQTGLFRFDPDDGMRFVMAVEPDRPAHRLNEGKVDADGNFWIGSFGMLGMPADGRLYRIRPDGIDLVLDGVRGPNSLIAPGVGIATDRFILADTPTGMIWWCTLDAKAGKGTRQCVRVARARATGLPDGSALSRDGLLWNARFGGGAVLAYDTGGAIRERIDLPVTQVTSCCFAGPGLDTLAITTARRRLCVAQRRRQQAAGDLFLVPIGVSGVPEPVTQVGI